MASIGSVIKKIMPFAAATLQVAAPGPIGMLAGMAAKALGASVEPTVEGVNRALETAVANPADLPKLKQIELDHAAQMRELGFAHAEEILQIEEKDRESARQRESSVKDWTPRILAFAIVGSSIGLCWYVLSGRSPVSHDVATAGLAGTVVGYIISEAKQVCAYYFGSSVGSRDKDVTIQQLSQ